LIAKLIFLSASKADPTGETEKVFSFVRTVLIDAYSCAQVSNERFFSLKTRPKQIKQIVIETDFLPKKSLKLAILGRFSHCLLGTVATQTRLR
jgi:hypothetical protein